MRRLTQAPPRWGVVSGATDTHMHAETPTVRATEKAHLLDFDGFRDCGRSHARVRPIWVFCATQRMFLYVLRSRLCNIWDSAPIFQILHKIVYS